MGTTRRQIFLAGLLVAAGACAPAPTPQLQITRPSATAPFDGTFGWTTIPDAKSYNIAVYGFDGARKFEVRDLTTGGVKLSSGLQLPPGPYSVQVTAMRDGTIVAETLRVNFEIK
jgi:hypothetical protein